MNRLAIVIRFVLHTLHRNINHLAIITSKTTRKKGKFERWGVEKARDGYPKCFYIFSFKIKAHFQFRTFRKSIRKCVKNDF